MSLQAEKILEKLVGFDTTSYNSNKDLIDYIRNYLEGFGVQSTLVTSEDGKKICLWATIGAGTKGVALAGHTDVVPVGGQKWTSDPFKLVERANKLYGRGSADMKGFIACALAFVPEFLAAKSKNCFHLAFTSDEETDMSGAMRLTDYLKTQGIKPEWIWIGEPTGLSIIDQHKGVAAYNMHIEGVSGHSSQPDKGLNAIELTAQFMEMVKAAADQKKAQPFAPSRFDPPYTTFNLGVIKGGTAENIIAEHCELLWQVRAHPGDNPEEIFANLKKRAEAEIASRLAPFAPKAKMKFSTHFDIPPFLSIPNNPGTRTLQALLKVKETHAVGFATEAGIFQQTGAGAVVCGPGFIEQAHQPDEFVDRSQLSACVDLMRRLLISSSPL